MDAALKIILVPICGVMCLSLAAGAAHIAGVDVGNWVAAERAPKQFEVCDEIIVPRPERQTEWGPVSTGSDRVRTNCTMVTR